MVFSGIPIQKLNWVKKDCQIFLTLFLKLVTIKQKRPHVLCSSCTLSEGDSDDKTAGPVFYSLILFIYLLFIYLFILFFTEI